ncbi:MAG: ribosome biogenesis GTP-binding protein YihA/YsxC [Proteobacteria bacterium]|nr:ribosome biogenesis GTP-binding protein YihA/YsxC [Pseudomonadota bacterium]
MIISSSEFVKSAVKPSHYPEEVLPEVAFVGRSNVGKSSLINTLLNRKRLVKTSSTPGRTQLINFFNINKTFSFVDLPGYGYAKVPKSVVKSWGEMIETYLSTRKTLKGVVMLMDIRRDPGKDEQDLVNWFRHHAIPTIFVLTKADKFSNQKKKVHHETCAEALGLSPAEMICFSAKTRLGRDRLLDEIKPWVSEQTNEF